MAIDPTQNNGAVNDDALQRAESILNSIHTLAGTSTKSAELQKLMNDRLVKSMMKLDGVTQEAAQQTIDNIKQEVKDAEKREKMDEYRAMRTKQLGAAFGQAAAGAVNLAKNAMSAAQSAYTSTEVFASMTPTLHLLGDTVKTVSNVMATAVSGIPIIGGLASAADKAFSAVVDISVAVAEMQIKQAQLYIDTYQKLSKAGVTFGGDITAMGAAAHKGGMDIQTYTKFITANIEQLSKIGGGLQGAANGVMDLTNSALTMKPKLLTIYGSMDELNGAFAGYASYMAGYGYDLNKDRETIKKGSVEYVSMLKVMSDLTGLSADQLRKETEERQSDIAWQAARQQIVAEKGEDYAQKLERVMTLAAHGNKDLERSFRESVSFRGRLVSADKISVASLAGNIDMITQFGAMARDKGITIEQLLEQVQQTGSDYASRMKSRAGAGDDPMVFFQLPGADAALGKAGAQITSGMASAGYFNNLKESFYKGVKEANAEETKESKSYRDAVSKMIADKIKQDSEIATTFDKVGGYVEGLRKVNNLLIEKFGELGELMPDFAKTIQNFIDLASGKGVGAEGPPPKETANLIAHFMGQGFNAFKATRMATIGGRGGAMESALGREEEMKKAAGTAGTTGILGNFKAPADQEDRKLHPKGTAKLRVPETWVKNAAYDNDSKDVRLYSAFEKLGEKYPLYWQLINGLGASSLDFVGINDSSMVKDQDDKVDWSLKGGGLGRMPENFSPEGAQWMWDFKPPKQLSDQVMSTLKQLGMKNIRDEYHKPLADTKEPHFHAEFDKGGSSSGIATDGATFTDGPSYITSTSKTTEIFMNISKSLMSIQQALSEQSYSLDKIVSHTK